MAFTPHVPCLTETGVNVTKGFEFCFKLGFFATAADFINSAFFEFYIRQRNHQENERYGYVTKNTLTLETIYAVMEWVFRALCLLVALLQAMIRSSKTGYYCTHELGVLADEGHWLLCLIVVSIFKIILLSAWHLVLNTRSKSFFADQFEQSTFMD